MLSAAALMLSATALMLSAAALMLSAAACFAASARALCRLDTLCYGFDAVCRRAFSRTQACFLNDLMGNCPLFKRGYYIAAA